MSRMKDLFFFDGWTLHHFFFYIVHHHHTVGQGCSTLDGSSHVYSFHHLFFICTIRHTRRGIGINAIRTLNRMGHSKGNKAFFLSWSVHLRQKLHHTRQRIFSHFLLKFSDVPKFWRSSLLKYVDFIVIFIIPQT